MRWNIINSSQRKCELNLIKMSVLKGRFLNLEGHLISQTVVVPESTFFCHWHKGVLVREVAVVPNQLRKAWAQKIQEPYWWQTENTPERRTHWNWCFLQHSACTCRPWNCSMDLRILSCPFEGLDLEYIELLLQFMWTRQWKKQRCHSAMQAKLFVKHLF